MRFVVLLLLLVACDPPDPNLVMNCQKVLSSDGSVVDMGRLSS
jgi:hypothetical protein